MIDFVWKFCSFVKLDTPVVDRSGLSVREIQGLTRGQVIDLLPLLDISAVCLIILVLTLILGAS